MSQRESTRTDAPRALWEQDALLRPLLASIPGGGGTDHRILHLKGDASSRRYFRIELQGAQVASAILMVMDPTAPLASEEAGWDHIQPDELLFVNVQKLLLPLELPVPRIYHYDAPNGLMLLQDLGDVTLEAWLRAHPREAWEGMYQKAVELLAQLQVRLQHSGTLSSAWASQVAFDERLLRWEFDHFYEYTLEKRRGGLSSTEYAVVDQTFTRLSQALAALPRFFVHRDYHSRNLMIAADAPWMIDFQDAVLGPRQYDLVSLLRDAYVTLTDAEVERLIAHYLSVFAQEGGHCPDEDPAAFRRHFEWMSLHRSMKAAGRFDFIDLVKKNPGFLQYIPSCLSNIRRILRADDSLHPLRAVLGSRLPELLEDEIPCVP